MVYFWAYLFICFCVFLELSNVERTVRNISRVSIVLMFIFLAGLRFETGVDWYLYTQMFNDTPPIDQITSKFEREAIFSTFDYGYCILISTVKFLGGGIQTVFLLVSMATSIFLYKGLKIYTEYNTLSLLLYYSLLFFILDMSGLRQGLALSIFLYAVQFLVKRAFWQYFLWIMIAAAFHWSAYILLLLYPFINKRFSSITLAGTFLFSLVIYFLNIKWLEPIIIMIFPSLENALLASKLMAYTANDTFSAARALNLRTILTSVFFISFLSFFIYYRKRMEEKYPYFNIFLNIYVLQIFVFYGLYEFTEMADRLKLYMLISTVVLLPYAAYYFRSFYLRSVVATYVFIFSIFSCQAYVLEAPTTIAYHPYQNYILYYFIGEEKSTGEQRLNKHAQFNE